MMCHAHVQQCPAPRSLQNCTWQTGPDLPGRGCPEALWCTAKSAKQYEASNLGDLVTYVTFLCMWCLVVPSGAICCAVICSTFLSASLRCAKACQYIQIRQVSNCPEQAGVPRIKNITDAIAEQQRGPLILLQTNSTGYTKPMRIQSIIYSIHRTSQE